MSDNRSYEWLPDAISFARHVVIEPEVTTDVLGRPTTRSVCNPPALCDLVGVGVRLSARPPCGRCSDWLAAHPGWGCVG